MSNDMPFASANRMLIAVQFEVWAMSLPPIHDRAISYMMSTANCNSQSANCISKTAICNCDICK